MARLYFSTMKCQIVQDLCFEYCTHMLFCKRGLSFKIVEIRKVGRKQYMKTCNYYARKANLQVFKSIVTSKKGYPATKG